MLESVSRTRAVNVNNERIAIVGIGLRYPDATSASELWANVLTGRTAFRLPSGAPAPGHYDAAETTADALADAGFPGGHGLPRRTTGVLVATREHDTDDPRSTPLLSVARAAATLADGDLDVALAGGGLPGDGCGVVVLMREAEALAQRRRVYASITGWGVAAAGERGDETAACLLALTRAHDRARYGAVTVSYFEGHETSAAVGALVSSRGAAPPAALGALTGNLGRATTGVAGLIKAALAVHHQVIPPVTGRVPFPAPTGDAPVYVPDDATLWPAGLPVRAGVTATGAGGSTHVALEEAPGRERRTGVARWTAALVAGRQDTDLLLVDAHSADGLRSRLTRLARLAARCATAEVTDLAGTLAIQQRGGPFRASVVAGDPVTAARGLSAAAGALATGRTAPFSPSAGVFLGHRTSPPRIAYLLPGRGAGAARGGALRRRFPVAAHLFGMAGADPTPDALVAAGSLAGLRVLHALGVDADVAVGHGIGALTARSWGGAVDGGDLLRIAGGGDRSGTVFGRPRRPVVATIADAVVDADLVLEVGPGRALSALAALAAPAVPVLALDTDSPSLAPLLSAVGAAYALGAAVDPTPLFADRVIRPITEDAAPWSLPEPRTGDQRTTWVTTVDDSPGSAAYAVLSGRKD